MVTKSYKYGFILQDCPGHAMDRYESFLLLNKGKFLYHRTVLNEHKLRGLYNGSENTTENMRKILEKISACHT